MRAILSDPTPLDPLTREVVRNTSGVAQLGDRWRPRLGLSNTPGAKHYDSSRGPAPRRPRLHPRHSPASGRSRSLPPPVTHQRLVAPEAFLHPREAVDLLSQVAFLRLELVDLLLTFCYLLQQPDKLLSVNNYQCESLTPQMPPIIQSNSKLMQWMHTPTLRFRYGSLTMTWRCS